MHSVVTGALFGLPGHGREVRFRILHVFEFEGDRIRREDVRLDGTAIQHLLTPTEPT